MISRVGFVRRSMAMMRRQSIGDRSLRPSNGVPGTGFRKLTGMESTSSSRSVKASSTRSSGDSPSPKIPPQQTHAPAAFAARTAATSSS